MQRRDFLKTMLPLGMYPLVTPSFPFRSLASTSPLAMNPCDVTDRALVIVFLSGGNDIINTMVPLNQMSEYNSLRPSLALPQSSLITLDSNLPSGKQLGLHPKLQSFKSLYDDGLLSVIQRVGYNNPNRSHFKSLDNWLTGSGGLIPDISTGWAGRFLEDRYPGYTGQPFLNEQDPLGVLFGKMNSTGFHTLDEHRYDINLSGQDLGGFYTQISGQNGDPIPNIPNTDHGEMLRHIEAIGLSVNVYAQRISETYNNGTNSSVSYPNSDLGNQLKSIARLMKGGSRTKFFMAVQGGFDTHVLMVDSSDTTQGAHANLLDTTGSSLKAFQDDLTAMGLADNVMTVVFSEFSRKAVQNASLGLGHGTLSSMFLMGNSAKGGVIGNNLDLTDLDVPGAINPAQIEHDYRQVFGTLVQDWLGASDSSLESTFVDPQVYLPKLSLIDPTNKVPQNCYYTPVVPNTCACFNIKLMLEGFYESNTLLMRDDLATANLIPLNQPYTAAPFNYPGAEAVTTFPSDTVDWVLVELRDTYDPSIVVARKAMLIRRDGFITDDQGNLGVEFIGVTADKYYLAIYHRTHLAILSSDTVDTNQTNFTYNFTISETMVAGNSQLKQVGTAWVMIAGDIDGNHAINSADYNAWTAQNGQTAVYSPSDINADGEVNSSDYDLWNSNRSKLGQLK